MSAEAMLHYLCRPTARREVAAPIQFQAVQDFLQDEAACKQLWEFLTTQFHTRRVFLTIWPAVRFVASHRDRAGKLDGLLTVAEHHNWQIDYVVVAPSARGQGIAKALVLATLNEACARQVPYVMLSSKESLRPLYEKECGFTVVQRRE
jgi:ribosomal protein S18 acetylase RimI-like enzyme